MHHFPVPDCDEPCEQIGGGLAGNKLRIMKGIWEYYTAAVLDFIGGVKLDRQMDELNVLIRLAFTV